MAIGVRKFLKGRLFTMMALVSIVIALFLRDTFVVLQVPTNTELDVILTLVLMLFFAEFCGLAATDASYIFGFFFWMDLVGTASMIFDITYMLGTDATQPNRVTDESASDNVIVVRAARAAKLGARAGRLSRVLKLLRFLPFINQDAAGNSNVKMARVISSQLTNVLSTRVAFLTITIVVVLPIFGIFAYPEKDDSMGAWVELLDRDAKAYYVAAQSGNSSLESLYRQRLLDATQEFSNFYAKLPYGPFSACYGRAMGGDDFECAFNIGFTSSFVAPNRRSSIREVGQDYILASFDLSTPKQEESMASMGLVICIIIVMCTFGLLMSTAISKIALQPLERMLNIVREHCRQIFKYTTDLQYALDEEESEEEDEAYDDLEQVSEFGLLEKVVAKLTGIADLAALSRVPEVKENMNENDIMTLNWMQGDVGTTQTNKISRTFVEDDRDEEGSKLILLGKMTATKLSNEVITSLNSPDFDSLELSKDTQAAIAMYLVTGSEGTSDWVQRNVQESQLCKFLSLLESKYADNPFHNFPHGVDVLYSCCRFMNLIQANYFIAETEQFWLMIAAISHDVGHLGVNNQYLVETSHELAMKYNDRSPMENMHCAKLFQIATDPEANIFTLLEKSVFKEMRKGMITAILHTDMTKHFEMIKEMSLLYQMNTDAFETLCPSSVVSSSQYNIQLVLNSVLHFSDIANPMKPWELAYKLANLCLDEFFAQGDKEKQAGIPVQMLNDRDKVNRPNSQVGFIEFVILPMCEVMVNCFPQIDSLAISLAYNIERWVATWVENYSPPGDDVEKVQARSHKVVQRCQAVTREHRQIPKS